MLKRLKKCWKDSRNVEKTQEDASARSSTASPEAKNVEKIQETHRRNVQKLAYKQKILKRLKKTHWRNLHKLTRKQEMLKRLKKTHRRNLHKLARKQEMLKRLKKTQWRHHDVIRQLGTELCSKPAEIRDLKFEYLHTEWWPTWLLKAAIAPYSSRGNSLSLKPVSHGVVWSRNWYHWQLTAASTHLTQICKR